MHFKINSRSASITKTFPYCLWHGIKLIPHLRPFSFSHEVDQLGCDRTHLAIFSTTIFPIGSAMICVFVSTVTGWLLWPNFCSMRPPRINIRHDPYVFRRWCECRRERIRPVSPWIVTVPRDESGPNWSEWSRRDSLAVREIGNFWIRMRDVETSAEEIGWCCRCWVIFDSVLCEDCNFLIECTENVRFLIRLLFALCIVFF